MATPFGPYIDINIHDVYVHIAYLNSPTLKTYYSCKKFLDFLHRTEIGAIFAYFCPNLVAVATPFAPLKILIAYLNSWTSKTFTKQISQYLIHS